MKQIHNNAIVEQGAVIGDNVTINANCFISKDAKIGNNTVLHQGACIYGYTDIDEGNEIFSYSVLGSVPQDLKYQGEKVELIIGKNNKIREFTLFNPGTKGGGSITKIGDGNLFMGYVHVAHDCIIGDSCIFANAVTLAGHVEVDNFAVIGGMTPVHQFVKIGELSMVAGASALSQDLPPYCLAEGNRAILRGLNLTGLRRHLERAEVDALKDAYRELFLSDKALKESAKEILERSDSQRVKKLCSFVLENKRGIPFKRNINE
jgi:UDP-N-acetylglucosamine acyltransferase